MEDTKGLSEFVNRRSIDKTMEKIKRTKEQTTIYKTLQKLECLLSTPISLPFTIYLIPLFQDTFSSVLNSILSNLASQMPSYLFPLTIQCRGSTTSKTWESICFSTCVFLKYLWHISDWLSDELVESNTNRIIYSLQNIPFRLALNQLVIDTVSTWSYN
jgi:uncharacterized membrane protein YheB (UPF0754 family)